MVYIEDDTREPNIADIPRGSGFFSPKKRHPLWRWVIAGAIAGVIAWGILVVVGWRMISQFIPFL